MYERLKDELLAPHSELALTNTYRQMVCVYEGSRFNNIKFTEPDTFTIPSDGLLYISAIDSYFLCMEVSHTKIEEEDFNGFSTNSPVFYCPHLTSETEILYYKSIYWKENDDNKKGWTAEGKETIDCSQT